MNGEKITIESSELLSPEVDAAIARQLSFGMADAPAPRAKTSLLYRPWFFLMVAGGLGSLVGWGMTEPFVDDYVHATTDFLVIPIIAGMIGLFIGIADGVFSRAARRAAISGLVGFWMGVGMSFALLFANSLYGKGTEFVSSLSGRYGLSLLAHSTLRGFAWMIGGVAAGMGQGIALHSSRLLRNGMLGGLIGGLLGGLLFDPIDEALRYGGFMLGGNVSRAVGFTIIGLCTGLMIGLVELLAREAWLKMATGPIAGKEFILHRNPTAIGSSPKADVYFFKDAEVASTHALIHQGPSGYEIEDRNTSAGTFVNGARVRRRRLVAGDLIRIGQTAIRFDVREGE